jgi:hypothetical protein
LALEVLLYSVSKPRIASKPVIVFFMISSPSEHWRGFLR